MQRGLGREENDSRIAERSKVAVDRGVCGEPYRFDPVRVAEVFRPGRDQPRGTSAIQ